MKSRNLPKPLHVVGVDEAGRGPLAGPVAVGVAVVPTGFSWKLIPGVGDSKQVSPENRRAIFRRVQELKKAGCISFHVALVSHRTIDSRGITKAVEKGIGICFKRLNLNPDTVEVRLDGLLRAPEAFKRQKTIIRGDAKEKVIGLASILAKVTRDRHMERLAKTYGKYGFEIHKGYGTLAHRRAIKKHGLSPVHRRSFCTKLLDSREKRV